MKLKFWGTRGSLPVALSLDQLRGKLADVLIANDGRRHADRTAALAFVTTALPFELGGGFVFSSERRANGRPMAPMALMPTPKTFVPSYPK